jgi:phosphohistidine phosphatase
MIRVVRLYLVHHGDAVGPEVDPQRPLSAVGRASVDFLASKAAARGIHPAVVWHSGKLRSKQTAEAFWRACNPLAEFSATRDLQPGDPPGWIRDRLTGEARDILLVGHFPHLPRLLALLLGQPEASSPEFPEHGMVVLRETADGQTWVEEWRIE